MCSLFHCCCTGGGRTGFVIDEEGKLILSKILCLVGYVYCCVEVELLP